MLERRRHALRVASDRFGQYKPSANASDWSGLLAFAREVVYTGSNAQADYLAGNMRCEWPKLGKRAVPRDALLEAAKRNLERICVVGITVRHGWWAGLAARHATGAGCPQGRWAAGVQAWVRSGRHWQKVTPPQLQPARPCGAAAACCCCRR